MIPAKFFADRQEISTDRRRASPVEEHCHRKQLRSLREMKFVSLNYELMVRKVCRQIQRRQIAKQRSVVSIFWQLHDSSIIFRGRQEISTDRHRSAHHRLKNIVIENNFFRNAKFEIRFAQIRVN